MATTQVFQLLCCSLGLTFEMHEIHKASCTERLFWEIFATTMQTLSSVSENNLTFEKLALLTSCVTDAKHFNF